MSLRCVLDGALVPPPYAHGCILSLLYGRGELEQYRPLGHD